MTLSLTHTTTDPDERRGWSRRRFLQAAAAAGVTSAALPNWMADAAGASTAAGGGDGTVVVLHLVGGCDSLELLAPMSGGDRPVYEAMRRHLAQPTTGLHAVDAEYGLTGRMPRLISRFGEGEVAVVRGLGLLTGDLSHFSASKTMMAGTDGPPTTGWLGRHLDTLADPGVPMRAISFSSSVPLQLLGRNAEVTALPVGVPFWGADTGARWERAAYDAMRAFAGKSSGLGAWADAVAETAAAAIESAPVASGILGGAPAGVTPLVRDLELAALALNAELGTKVITLSSDGFDTHAGQDQAAPRLLADLDNGINRFFTTLDPAVAGRVTLVVLTEFGRRLETNGSSGTDHGRAGTGLVIGRNVRGGLHGHQPSLRSPDARGNLVPTTSFVDLYATLLDRWMGGNASSVFDGTFAPLDLFAAPPGA